MREYEGKEKQRENSRPTLSLFQQKQISKVVSTRFGLSLYSAQISKNTKILSIPIIHEGQNGKKLQKGSQTGSKGQKIKKHFRICAKILHSAKISHPSAKLLNFLVFSALFYF